MDAHAGTEGGCYAGREITQKILRAGLWWPTLHQDSKVYCKACDVCQRTGKPSQRDEMSLNPQTTLCPFEKWAINFVGPIHPQGKTGARYIITATECLTCWAEVQPMKDCMDVHVPAVLWAYRTTCKKLMGQTPFRLVYGVEFVMPMEYIMHSLCIASVIGMMDHRALEERLAQLDELEEERFLAGCHQQVQKQRRKAWHDRHIKLRTFKVNDLVLLYDSKFDKFLEKLRMHWLGPYVIKEITDGGAA
eukprot:PITA_36588